MKLTTATTAPISRNLSDFKPGNAYEVNYNCLMADQCREEYARAYASFQALSAAHVAGFLDITVRTSTGSVTIPFIGAGATQRAQTLFLELAEMLGDKLSKLESQIVQYEQDSQENEPAEREGCGSRAELFAFCLPMRPLSDAEFTALPTEARRAYDERRAGEVKAA